MESFLNLRIIMISNIFMNMFRNVCVLRIYKVNLNIFNLYLTIFIIPGGISKVY